MSLPASLVEAVRAQGSGLAVFDADGTLWRDDVGEAFLKHLVKLGWVTLPDGRDPYEEYERRVEHDRATGYAFAAQLHAGLHEDRVGEEAQRFASAWVPKRLISATRALAALCIESGLAPMVVSASALPIVRAAAPLAGFTRFRGIETNVVDGRFTAELVPPLTYAEGKIAAAGGPIALACGDSFTGDLAMMKVAAIAVCVAPSKGSPLADEARRQGWPVLPQDL